MVRYQKEDKPAGISDSSSLESSGISVGVKTASTSLAVVGSYDVRSKSTNLRPHHVICRNSLTFNLELQSRKLSKDGLAPNWNNETNICGSHHEIQELLPYHDKISWFEGTAGTKHEIAILNSLRKDLGGNEREVRDRSWKVPDAFRGESSTNTGDLNWEVNLSLGSLETADITVHTGRDSDSFRHACSRKKVLLRNCKHDALDCKHSLVSWKPELMQFHLLEHETAASLNHKRKLEPTEDSSEVNVKVNLENSTRKDSSNILLAHEGNSISSSEDQSTTTGETPRNATRSVFNFARESRLLGVKLVDSPTTAEIEEFFLEDEKQRRRNFMARYNYDLLNDVPLTGRFEWEQLQR